MNFKQFGGVMLLMVVLIVMYGLFGVNDTSINRKVVQEPQVKVNVSENATPEIRISEQISFEEQCELSVFSIGAMVIAIIATSLGTWFNSDIYKKDELELETDRKKEAERKRREENGESDDD